jgi:tetratricopeptide (TPR) repeat protein
MSDNCITSPSRLARWIPLLLIVVTVLAFSGILPNRFTLWDDEETIAANPNLNPPTLSGLAAHWRAPHMDLYVPATYTLWWTVAKIAWHTDDTGGYLDPRPFHVASLALHVLAALVVFALLRRLLRKDWPAAVGALIFALHPLQVETVAWISGAKDLLGGLLVLVALWQYTVAFDPNDPPKRPWMHYALATVSLALALLAKPVAVVAPLLAVVIDRFMLNRNWRSIGRSIAPWIALIIPCLIWTKLAQPAGYLPASALWQRPLIAADALAFYLHKLIWPLALAPDYGHRPVAIFATGAAYWTWLLPAALIAALWWKRRGNAPLLVGLSLALIALLPVLGLTAFDFQTYSTTADHYLYLPMAGIALAAAWIVTRMRPNALAIASVSCVLLACGLLSSRQTHVWRDSQSLFAHTIEVNPDSYAGYSNLATLALRQAQEETLAAQSAHMVFDDTGAARHRAQAAQLNNDYFAMARQAYRVRPDSIRTLRRMGDALLRLDRPSDAVPYLRKAVSTWEQLRDDAQKREYATTPRLLAIALLETNHPDEAIQCCERTLAYVPDDATTLRVLAQARARMARIE